MPATSASIAGRLAAAADAGTHDVIAHFPGLRPEVAADIAASMKRPEGTVAFRGAFPTLLDPKAGSGFLLQVVTGGHIFVLERDADLVLQFVHGSPGTGTRLAAVDLKELDPEPGTDRFFFTLTWSPRDIDVDVGQEGRQNLHHGAGIAAPFSLQVDKNGNVHRIGDSGVEVAGVRLYVGGDAVLSPPAIRLWQETKQAIETLLTGESDRGYMFEVALANASLSALVTGFETYGHERLLARTRVRGDPC